MMWREQYGCFEMLLAYMYENSAFAANKSYREFLIEILTTHERTLKRGGQEAEEESAHNQLTKAADERPPIVLEDDVSPHEAAAAMEAVDHVDGIAIHASMQAEMSEQPIMLKAETDTDSVQIIPEDASVPRRVEHVVELDSPAVSKSSVVSRRAAAWADAAGRERASPKPVSKTDTVEGWLTRVRSPSCWGGDTSCPCGLCHTRSSPNKGAQVCVMSQSSPPDFKIVDDPATCETTSDNDSDLTAAQNDGVVIDISNENSGCDVDSVSVNAARAAAESVADSDAQTVAMMEEAPTNSHLERERKPAVEEIRRSCRQRKFPPKLSGERGFALDFSKLSFLKVAAAQEPSSSPSKDTPPASTSAKPPPALAVEEGARRLRERRPTLESMSETGSVLRPKVANPAAAAARRRHGVLKCSVCYKPFKYATSLQKHERKHPDARRGVKQSFACSLCEKLFHSLAAKIRHERCHEDAAQKERPAAPQGQHKCIFCAKPFAYRLRKINHEKSLCPKRPRRVMPSVQCRHCPKTFIYPSAKLKHERLHHPASRTVRSAGDENAAAAEAGEDKAAVRRQHLCAFCAKPFAYQLRKANHEQFLCPKRKQRVVRAASIQCQFCPMTFSHVAGKLRHEELHHELPQWRFRGAPDKENAAQVAEKGAGDDSSSAKQFACSVCKRMFAKYRAKLMHEKRAHRGMRRFGARKKQMGIRTSNHQCSVCSRSFLALRHLRIHEIVHKRAELSERKNV